MNRRNFVRKLGLTSIGVSMMGLYTWQIEPFWLEVVERPLPITNLPKSLKGKTLMQISDIHVGNRFDWQFIIDTFISMKKYEPDFVVYTGDYVSYENDRQIDQLDIVMEHCVKGKLGTFGILGNHDYGHKWKDNKVAKEISNVLENWGVRVLRNDAQTVENLKFIGIDDYWSPNWDLKKAIDHYDPNMANIVLCHNPDACDKVGWGDYQGWILAGHTHGGQCKPPFLPPPLLPVDNKKYTQGHIDLEDGRHLYINRALGHLFQVRFNVRPEVTIFTLE